MNGRIKQTIAECVRIAYESPEPDSYDIARNIAEAYGYSVNELLELELPKKHEWYKNIPEHGVLCWYEEAVVLATDYYPNPNGKSSVKLASHRITNDVYVYTSFIKPLTNEEIEAFKR